MKKDYNRTLRFFLILGGIFIVGACLRFYLLSSQILLDDEWHSPNAVIGKGYADVLTRFDPHDNTSPLFNLYDLALYQSLGWSEFTLRLPVILAGLISLIILPVLVEKMFNERVSLIFAGLLAISPVLIFYSRYARAYGLVTLLCFSALLLSCQWLTTGRFRYATGFVLTGVFAVYAHLFALVAVFMPIAIGFGFGLAIRFKRTSSACRQVAVSFRSLLMAALIMVAPLLPLLRLVFLQKANLPWEKGNITLNGVVTAASLMAGTANGPLILLFFLLLMGGYIFLFRRNQLLGWIFLSTTTAYVLVLLVSRPLGLGDGAVMLRYMIVVAPMSLTLVALAMDHLLQRVEGKGIRRSFQIPGVAGFLGLLYAAGPLPALYHSPDNFTNHSSYQGSYKRHTWEFAEANTVFPGFSIGKNQIPAFYLWLQGQSNIRTIIEYPFDICDFNNLFYYYQHFHKKRVIAGYCSGKSLLGCKYPTAAGGRLKIAFLSADQILSRGTDPAKLGFRNMVDVINPAAILDSKADILVLHKYIMSLRITLDPVEPERVYGTIPLYYDSVGILKAEFERDFGRPVYEDEQIVCFQVIARVAIKL